MELQSIHRYALPNEKLIYASICEWHWGDAYLGEPLILPDNPSYECGECGHSGVRPCTGASWPRRGREPSLYPLTQTNLDNYKKTYDASVKYSTGLVTAKCIHFCRSEVQLIARRHSSLLLQDCSEHQMSLVGGVLPPSSDTSLQLW